MSCWVLQKHGQQVLPVLMYDSTHSIRQQLGNNVSKKMFQLMRNRLCLMHCNAMHVCRCVVVVGSDLCCCLKIDIIDADASTSNHLESAFSFFKNPASDLQTKQFKLLSIHCFMMLRCLCQLHELQALHLA